LILILLKLDSRLTIAQSSNLDHGYSLTRRIRVAQKQRVELREDVMRIRRERETIALRMDEIRIKQEENNKHFLVKIYCNPSLTNVLIIPTGKERNQQCFP